MSPAEPDRRLLGRLSEAGVTARLGGGGYNDLPTARCRGFITIATDLLREPMFVLLVACGVIYVVLGDPQEASSHRRIQDCSASLMVPLSLGSSRLLTRSSLRC